MNTTQMPSGKQQTESFDVIILGGGAAGFFCAIHAAYRGLSVLLLEKSEKPMQKILISGGGRCNFTNLNASHQQYLCPNPHFVKSALSRFTPHDFIDFLDKHGVTYHEKAQGQLFCDNKASAITDLFLQQATRFGVTLKTNADTTHIDYDPATGYRLSVQWQQTPVYFQAPQLVIATGGPAIAQIGATADALRFAKQFAIKNTPFSPALVPLLLDQHWLNQIKPLAGVSTRVSIQTDNAPVFDDDLLFTHRGLSGPAVLQISSFWQKNQPIQIDFAPHLDIFEQLKTATQQQGKRQLATVLSQFLPKALATFFAGDNTKPIAEYANQNLLACAQRIKNFSLTPSNTAGFKKAEVARGGLLVDAFSSKTLMAKQQPNLFAIGEALDVTGYLGGYNFQWAWSSGFVVAQTLLKDG